MESQVKKIDFTRQNI